MRFALIVLAALAATAPLAPAEASRAIRAEIPAAQAEQFIGREGTVCGVVAGARFAENAEGQPTFLFLGAAFPNHPFSARVWGRDREALGVDLDALTGRTVCVSGDITSSNNRPEIVVRGARSLKVS